MMTRNVLSAAALTIAGVVLAGCSGQSADGQQAAANTTPGATAQASAPSGSGPRGRPDNGDGARRLASDYKQRCASGQKPADNCDTLRRLLVAEVSTALDLMVTSKDQRNVPQALAAFDFPEEPDIIIAACRILAQFPTTPGIVDKAMPQLLRNRSIDVQRAAAGLLSSIPDVGAVEAGQLWSKNHTDLVTAGPWNDYPGFPAQYGAMGFPKYPGAEWFSPADTDRAVGWSTKDDASKVTQWFAQTLRAEPMDLQQWSQQIPEQLNAINQGSDPSGSMQRMQALMQRAFSGDKTAAAELEKIQKEFEKAADAARDGMNNAVSAVTPPDSAATLAHWIVARAKGKRFSTVVIVYPLPSLQRTVIQTVWDLSDYPSAWPEPLQGQTQ
jgi:hypothetical protein